MPEDKSEYKSEYKFAQGDRVVCRVRADFQIEGLVVGCCFLSKTGTPEMYLVRVIDRSLPTESYPFTTLSVPTETLSLYAD